MFFFTKDLYFFEIVRNDYYIVKCCLYRMEDDQQPVSCGPVPMDTFQQFEKPPYKHLNHADEAFDILSTLRR